MRCRCSCRAGSKNAHTHAYGAGDKHTHTHTARERIIYAQARATHSPGRSLCHSQRIFMAFQLVHVRFFFLLVVAIRLVRFLSQRRQLSGERGVVSASRGAFIRGALHKILAKSRTRCQQAEGSRLASLLLLLVLVRKQKRKQKYTHAQAHTEHRRVEAAKQQQP